MLIDCDSCTARPVACGGCVVTHLLQVGPVRASAGAPWPDPVGDPVHDPAHDPGDAAPGPAPGPGPVPDPWAAELTDSEVAAMAVLSAGGLVPPLRLVTPGRPDPSGAGCGERVSRRGGPAGPGRPARRRPRGGSSRAG